MYLSSLLVDVGDNPDHPRPGRLWLRNLYRVHQRLCMAFPSSKRRRNDPDFVKTFDPDDFEHVHGERTDEQAFLFRIDPVPGGSPVILVQSAEEPDWKYAFHNAGYLLACQPQIRHFDPDFAAGQALMFRLAANPTKRLCSHSKGSDGAPIGERWIGKRVPVATDGLEEWLTGRSAVSGFSVERLDSIQTGYVYFDKKRLGGTEEKSRLRYVRYGGVLSVTDQKAFATTLVRGIGPGKAFGFGLLSIAPAKD